MKQSLQILGVFCLGLTLFCAMPAGAQAEKNGFARSPYMGWSSWSHYQSRVTEADIKANADVLADKLKASGYIYCNVDDAWQRGFDANGYPAANPQTFPGGIKALADYVHNKGLKFGIYLVPGIPKELYDLNPPIVGTKYHIQDITDIMQHGSTKRGTYKIDYSKPGSVEYIQGYAKLYADWGIDFIKMDFVGPGGGNNPADTRDDLRQWAAAIKRTGRPMWIELSNSLKIANIADWKASANGWRIGNDVERYGTPYLTNWAHVARRFNEAPAWATYAAPGGWNDLDSLEIGNGDFDGLTPDERVSIMTLWAISCAPLSLGSDLTKLDASDYALLTNKEVIAIDQAGHVATPISQDTPQQVWSVHNPDGTWTVALFNLGTTSAPITVNWMTLYAPTLVGSMPLVLQLVPHTCALRDLWSHTELGKFDIAFTATLAPHACRLLLVYPNPEIITNGLGH